MEEYFVEESRYFSEWIETTEEQKSAARERLEIKVVPTKTQQVQVTVRIVSQNAFEQFITDLLRKTHIWDEQDEKKRWAHITNKELTHTVTLENTRGIFLLGDSLNKMLARHCKQATRTLISDLKSLPKLRDYTDSLANTISKFAQAADLATKYAQMKKKTQNALQKLPEEDAEKIRNLATLVIKQAGVQEIGPGEEDDWDEEKLQSIEPPPRPTIPEDLPSLDDLPDTVSKRSLPPPSDSPPSPVFPKRPTPPGRPLPPVPTSPKKVHQAEQPLLEKVQKEALSFIEELDAYKDQQDSVKEIKRNLRGCLDKKVNKKVLEEVLSLSRQQFEEIKKKKNKQKKGFFF
jgi:hypothetical protein